MSWTPKCNDFRSECMKVQIWIETELKENTSSNLLCDENKGQIVNVVIGRLGK
jgi:hypothetical protein